MYDAKLRDLYAKSDLPLNLQRFFKNLKLASSLSLQKISRAVILILYTVIFCDLNLPQVI